MMKSKGVESGPWLSEVGLEKEEPSARASPDPIPAKSDEMRAAFFKNSLRLSLDLPEVLMAGPS
jgi:hypothetical protein